jgi:hypothetical protein
MQEPSVALVVQLLDGTSFRPGGKTMMLVSPAKFERKGNNFMVLHQYQILLCAISCKIVTDASNVFQVLFSFQRKLLENCNRISHKDCQTTSYVSIRPDL